MKLSKILSESGLNFKVSSDPDIKGITNDSREVGDGFLFVAVKGFSVDGHRFVESAVEKGAVAVVVDRDKFDKVKKKVKSNAEVIPCDDTRAVESVMADVFYRHPSRDLKVVGITGTNGKTTTSFMLYEIFKNHFGTAGLIGTVKYIIGSEELPSVNTTPDSILLQKTFRDMVDRGVKAVAMEVSSHALVLKRVESVDFDVGVFTNLTQDHLDFHGSMDEYLKAKLHLFEVMKNGKKDSIAVLNADSDVFPVVRAFLRTLNVPFITFGITKPADYQAKNVSLSFDGIRYSLFSYGDFVADVEVGVSGFFNVYNSLSAFAVSDVLGIPIEDVLSGLKNTRVSGRFEVVKVKDFYVVIDYAHTPDALERLLRSVQQIRHSRITVVFGAGGDRDKTKRKPMGEIASFLADRVIITSDNPRTENPEQIIKDIMEGVDRDEPDEVIVEVNRKKAIEYALSTAVKNEIVVIAGKGHEDYQIIGTQKIYFSDREVVEEWKKRNG